MEEVKHGEVLIIQSLGRATPRPMPGLLLGQSSLQWSRGDPGAEEGLSSVSDADSCPCCSLVMGMSP